jgi:hypothetical protein
MNIDPLVTPGWVDIGALEHACDRFIVQAPVDTRRFGRPPKQFCVG